MFTLILILALAASPENLIQNLGDNSYKVRKQAYESLEFLDTQAIPSLIKGSKNEDIEIRLQCQHLLRKLRRVYPTDYGKYGITFPDIWTLPNNIRFQCKNGRCRDLAYEYYVQVYSEAVLWERFNNSYERGMMDEWEQALEDYYIGSGEYTFNFRHETAGIWATIVFIGDRRNQGMTKEAGSELLDQMLWNKDNLDWINKYRHYPSPMFNVKPIIKFLKPPME